MLNFEEIKQLLNEIDRLSINEFSYEKDDIKIKIKKSEQSGQVSYVTEDQVSHIKQVPQQQMTTHVDPVENGHSEGESKNNVVEEIVGQLDENVVEITSPMVGTFYRKPSPESDNYVDIGDKIDESTIVCIVEAMKLFNEIEAEVAGEIVAVLVEDGELVEYGQPLFKVKTN